MDRALLISVHLFGVLLWIGGVTVASMAIAHTSDASRQPVAVSLRQAAALLITPGLILAWAGGLALLLPNFANMYAKAGWMHSKLLIAVLATGVTGLVTARLKKLAKGEGTPHLKRFRLAAIGMAVFAAMNIFLAVVQPGA